MTVTVTDNTAALMRAVRALTQSEVLVGIPADTPARASEAGDATPIANAALGYLMERGSPANNLPPRPFLVPGVEAIREPALARLKKAGQQALAGDVAQVDKALHAVGLMGQNAVRKKITDGPFTPLAPRTLQQRRARGRSGEKPLIDTGALRASLTYVVRKRNGR